MKTNLLTRLLLALMPMLLLTAFPASAYDFSAVNDDGVTIYYNINPDNTSVSVTYQDENFNSYSSSVVIPESLNYNSTTYAVSSIGEQAFRDCLSLNSVSLPNSLTTIGSFAFFDCVELASITIPNSVTTISEAAFSGCSALSSIDIPESVTSIENGAFNCCSSLSSIILPESLTTIAEGAFAGCTSLTSITIPNSVIEISNPFFRCISLRSFKGKYSSDDNRCLIKDDVLVSFAPAGLTTYTLPEGIKTIGNWAFYECQDLTSVSIPNSVTSISKYAFGCCGRLSTITIPESLLTIDDYAFLGCSSLSNITIPNSVTKIGVGAFQFCSGLTSIDLSTSIDYINYFTFEGCSTLSSITIPESVTGMGQRAFGNCPSLVSFNGKFASEDHRCLINDGTLLAFAPAGLETYTIPDEVKSIGLEAFYGCRLLTSVILPNSLTEIGSGAFFDNKSLRSITIPSSIKSIETCTFFGCNALISITIPNAISKIGSNAFDGCSGLKEIYVENDNPTKITMEESVFGGVPFSTCVLYVPKGSEDLYRAAEQWGDFQNIRAALSAEWSAEPVQLTIYDDEVVPDIVIMNMGVCMSNDAPVIGFQCDITIPDNGIGPDITAATLAPRGDASHEMSISRLLNGDFRIVSFSNTNQAYSGDSGVLFYLPFTTNGVNNRSNAGSYPIKIHNIRVAGLDGAEAKVDDVITSVTLKNEQTISWECPTEMGMGESLTLEATSNRGLDVSYEIISGSEYATLTGNVLKAYAVGEVVVRASQAGDDLTLAAEDVEKTITITLGYIPGDANDDESVTIADVTTTVNYLLEQNPDPFNFAAADMNENGEISIVDVTLVVAEVMAQPAANSRMQKPSQTAEEFNLAIGDNGLVATLSNAQAYVAMQFDLELPDGVEVTGVTSDDSHMTGFANLGNGYARVVVYSLDNAAFVDGSIDIRLSKVLDGTYTLHSALINRMNGANVEELAAAGASADTTGISLTTEDEECAIYNLNGIQMSRDNLAPCVYIRLRGNKAEKVMIK